MTGEVRKRVVVRRPPAEAFELFTAGMGTWWPLGTHSVGAAHAVDVVVEPGVGGKVVEHLDDGTTSTWGTIEVWQPPTTVRLSWHPGTPPAEATTVEVTFRATGDGTEGTVVELVHTGWDRRPDGAEARQGYDVGWEVVLGRYVEST